MEGCIKRLSPTRRCAAFAGIASQSWIKSRMFIVYITAFFVHSGVATALIFAILRLIFPYERCAYLLIENPGLVLGRVRGFFCSPEQSDDTLSVKTNEWQRSAKFNATPKEAQRIDCRLSAVMNRVSRFAVRRCTLATSAAEAASAPEE
jgi:hypothetical protein